MYHDNRKRTERHFNGKRRSAVYEHYQDCIEDPKCNAFRRFLKADTWTPTAPNRQRYLNTAAMIYGSVTADPISSVVAGLAKYAVAPTGALITIPDSVPPQIIPAERWELLRKRTSKLYQHLPIGVFGASLKLLQQMPTPRYWLKRWIRKPNGDREYLRPYPYVNLTVTRRSVIDPGGMQCCGGR